MKADFDDTALAGRRRRVLRHLDHQPVARPMRVDAVRSFDPHDRFAASDHQRRATSIELIRHRSALRVQTVDRPLYPASGITTTARFAVDAGPPGPDDGTVIDPASVLCRPLEPPCSLADAGAGLPNKPWRVAYLSLRRGIQRVSSRRSSGAWRDAASSKAT